MAAKYMNDLQIPIRYRTQDDLAGSLVGSDPVVNELDSVEPEFVDDCFAHSGLAIDHDSGETDIRNVRVIMRHTQRDREPRFTD
jgi:hypothetical protein